MSTRVVSALASSLGMWKVSTAADPGCAEPGVTVM
jgi:hypothetical protein